MRTSFMLPAFILAGLALPAIAQMPTSPKAFVAKAGASDKFEIDEANLMLDSANPQIKMIAQQMIRDHTDSTAKIKAAAMSDGTKALDPVLSSKQRVNINSLRQKSGGERDALYLRQQVPAHQEALALMQGYASSGKTPALRQAATEISPVVQGHLDMIQQAQNKPAA